MCLGTQQQAVLWHIRPLNWNWISSWRKHNCWGRIECKSKYFSVCDFISTKVSSLNSTENHKDKSISKVRNWSYTTELLLRMHADVRGECCGLYKLWRSVGRQEMVMVMAIFNHMQYLHHIDTYWTSGGWELLIFYICVDLFYLKTAFWLFPLLFDLCPLYPLHSYFPHHWVRLPMNNDDWLLWWTNGTWISIILHPGNQEIIFPAIFYPTLKCIFIEKQYWMYWKNTVPILKTWLRGWIVAAKFLHFQISIIDTLKS